jgi:xylan 1,4-beta-xylosidase
MLKNRLSKKTFSFIKLISMMIIICMLVTASTLPVKAYTSDLGNGNFQNPVMYADYPDNCVIKVGTTYYMECSSINYMPGLPILKSEDLVNWEICSYAYDRIDVGMSGIDKTHADAYNLVDGKNVYSHGCWAPSLKYHDGTFYATFSSLDLGKTFVCTRKGMGFGGWTFTEISGIGYAHDADLFFDTDGRVYLVNGGCTLTELTSDCKSVKAGGINKKIFDGGSSHDGNRIFKRNGYYYILSTPCKENVSYYQRIEKAWRSKSLTGPYEQKVILDDGGNHQACVVEDGEYNWAVLFEDKGGVGRIPKVAPVTWINDWPMIGINGNGKVPATYKKPVAGNGIKSPGTSDEFADSSMSSQWQWNHNPDNSKWSLSERSGWLRLKSSNATDLLQARNTLTQRIQGPTSSGWVKLDATNIKPGQIAGLSAFHCKYGYIAVRNDNGTKKLVQYNVTGSETSVNLTNNIVYLKVDADCNAETAKFYYSYNESNWTQLGDTLGMDFYYKLWFVGYRFALFNFTTGSDTSGYADFDYFSFSPTATGLTTPTHTPMPTDTPTPRSAFSQIEAEDFNSQSGIQTESCSEGGNNVGYIENGDYAVYNNINFDKGAGSFEARVASNVSGGDIEIRLDSINGSLIGTCPVTGTGGWQTYETAKCNVSGVSGTHDLYLKFTGGSSYLFNLNWWKFNPISSVKYGDINGDGLINSVDYSLIKRYLLNQSTTVDLKVSDLDGDGRISSVDCALLKRYILGIITQFPVSTK